MPKIPGFPQDNTYSPEMRQYLMRLDRDRTDNSIDLSSINNSITSLNGRVSAIELDIGRMQAEYNLLSARVDSNSNAILTLQNSVSTMRADLDEAMQHITNMQTELNTANAAIAALDVRVTALEG